MPIVPVYTINQRGSQLLAVSEKSDGTFATSSSTAVDIPGFASISFQMPDVPVIVRGTGAMVSTPDANAAVFELWSDGVERIHDATGWISGSLGVFLTPEIIIPNTFYSPEPGDTVTFVPRVRSTVENESATLVAGNFFGTNYICSLYAYTLPQLGS